MHFAATAVADVFVVDTVASEDDRGAFVRLSCERTLAAHGMVGRFIQTSLSISRRRGTLRGMHYQVPPHEEAKLVRCIRGRILDVALDLRPSSPTYLTWTAVELTADNRRALYIPAGCAHGLLTLEDDCHVLYQISAEHEPAAARGVRWNDPAFAIAWPMAPVVMSERDAAYPDYHA